jgi:hypothetical protein
MVTPPIIVVDGQDVWFHASEKAVSHHFEPSYLADTNELAFDSTGRRVELVVERRTIPRRWLPDRTDERVGVRLLGEEPTHADELASILREHLERAGLSTHGSETLKALLDRAIERSGYT